MSEQRVVFADWVGEAVTVFYPGGRIAPDYGVLEEVNDYGIVLRSRRRVSWPTGGPRTQWGDEPREQDVREVSVFRPWHVISGVRVLESEEREAYGL